VAKHSLYHIGKIVDHYSFFGVGGTYTITGVASAPTGGYTPPEPPSWTQEQLTLQGLYPEGYKKARPGNAVASVGQFLVELRDLPRIPGAVLAARKVPFSQVPRVLLKSLTDYKELGSEYLNVVFGWKPFVSDVRKAYRLWHDVDKRLGQIIRENGKTIRRKATVTDEDNTTEGTTLYGYPYANVYGNPPTWMGGSTRYVVKRRTKEHVWFSGAFRYYIPDVGSSQWTRRARLALFGGLPTPELLWEVLPWSWLIDWFANVGDVVSNVSPNAVDNLTVARSFIMRHTLQSTEWSAHVVHGPGDGTYLRCPSVNQTFLSVETTETKSRVGGGNPFGLGAKLSQLSAGQLAILAAMGISRGTVR